MTKLLPWTSEKIKFNNGELRRDAHGFLTHRVKEEVVCSVCLRYLKPVGVVCH